MLVWSPVTIASRMAACHLPWGVRWSRTKEGCGMVVKQVLHVLEAAIGVPNLASAGPCEVRVLLVVDSVELTAETQDDTDANLKCLCRLDADSSC